MTVIAYHHASRTVACDSRAATDEGLYSSCKKFEMLPSGAVIVFAGIYNNGRELIRLLKKGKPIPDELYTDTTVVVLGKTGTLTVFDESPAGEVIRKNWAWGSGCDFALGAMFAGADAEQAVRAAIKYNNTCGGKVHVFTTRK